MFAIVPSQLPQSRSLLSVIFMLVPITSRTNKLDLLSEKSLRLVNTALNPCERQREYLQKEYMSIDRPSWPRLVSTIAHYWCAGIAFEGRQIDIMVWCGPLRAGLGCWSLIHWPWVNVAICIGPVWCLCWGRWAGRHAESSERGWSPSLDQAQTGNGPLLLSQLIFTANRLMPLILCLL